MLKRYPLVAIVGRPNVGKSTLFNRLIGRKYAVTSEIPGTTRDRLYHPVKFDSFNAILIDTGGLGFEANEDLEKEVQIQVRLAIAEADIIYFVIDASSELTATDLEAAAILRKTKKPVMLIANKCDRKRAEEYKYNLYKLGFGEAFQISSIHNQGFDEIIEKTANELKNLNFEPVEEKIEENLIRLAILGRPNVGKSTLLNTLMGKQRAIVSEIPGTTRDTLDEEIIYEDQHFLLIDTAGIRRRGKIQPGLEKFSVFRALDAVYRSHIILLMIDAKEGITNQDCHVSEFALSAGKGLIIVVNKCDLMEDRKFDEETMIDNLQRKMSYTPWAPVVFISAKNGRNVFKILELAKQISQERSKKIPDSVFKYFIQKTTIKHPPPPKGTHFTKIFEGKQVSINPPTFVIAANYPDALHFSYIRYLENEIRKKFGFTGTSIKLEFRTRI